MFRLHELTDHGDIAGLQKCLRNGENPNVQDIDGDTPLHYAAFILRENPQICEVKLQIARILIHFGASLDEKNNFGNTPLHIAAACRNYKMIDILLEANAQIDLKDNDGNTGLHYAINNYALLQRINPDYICADDHSYADWKTFKQLLKYKPDINATNNLKESPLMWAVKVDNFGMVQELSQRGAFQCQADENFNTALHLAVDKPEVNVNIVAELIRHGSLSYFRNKKFLSPLDIYFSSHHYAPPAEIKKAPLILKYLSLQRNFLKRDQIRFLIRHRLYSIFSFNSEVCRMERDKIISRDGRCLSVYDIIFLRGSAYRPLPPKLWYKLLSKLLTGEYRIYSDVIASCFPRTYLCSAFAAICRWMERDKVWDEFLNYDVRYWLSYNYLSPYDMYTMMIAGKR